MLLCLTANHRNTEFDVLDRVARSVDGATAPAFTRYERIQGAVVLATCNRFEAYLDLDASDFDAEGRATQAEALAKTALAGLLRDGDVLAKSVVTLVGDAAVRHLFAVSSGLESMVMGEDEISGQVQRALVASREAGATTGRLEQVFQRAASTNRAVRARTDLAAGGRSLVRAVLDMMQTRVADWSPIPILIVGTGSYAATTIQTLRARGAQNLRVFSATGRAAQFARRFDVTAEHDLPDAISRARFVMTCTARYTLTPEQIIDDKKRVIIDLGLPRNVDPAVGELPGIELIDLAAIGSHTVLPERADTARNLVHAHAEAFAAERAAAPAIVSFRRHVGEILEAELERLPRVSSDAGAQTVERALRHFAGVIAHGPSVRAREYAAAGRLDEYESALLTVMGVDRHPRG